MNPLKHNLGLNYMKNSQTDLETLNNRRNFDRWSIWVAVQVIGASILYLLFFT
jgi:accessory colonization factor AcfC